MKLEIVMALDETHVNQILKNLSQPSYFRTDKITPKTNFPKIVKIPHFVNLSFEH